MERVHMLVLPILLIAIIRPVLSSITSENNESVRWYLLKQNVDHFIDESPQFDQRYYYRDDLWKSGGPIYVYIGGEYSADNLESHLTSGLVADLARETHGVMYLLEHRYFGYSKIPSDLEETKYGNLTVKQVLADIAHFLTKIKQDSSLHNSKIVVVGGSYAGRLATWMRLKYPDLVDAAIASSAPLKNTLEFPEYYETVAEVYTDYGGYRCLHAIQNKIRHEKALFRRERGEEIFKLEENFCPEVILDNEMKKNMYSVLALNHITDPVIEFDLDKIAAKCNQILSLPNSSPTSRVGAGDEGCYSYNFSITGWPESPYDFLRCAELGQFPTSSDESGLPFHIPSELYTERCVSVYGEKYGRDNIRHSLYSLDEEFGGAKPNVTQVVFVNGGLDPWHHLGILNDLSEKAPALFIRNGTHCLDLYPNDPSDSFELRDVRARMKELIKQWIHFRKPVSAGRWSFFKPSPSWDHIE